MTQTLEDYIEAEWLLTNETKDYYVLQKTKPFSIGWMLFWFFTTFFGAFVYVAYHFSKKPQIKLLSKLEE